MRERRRVASPRRGGAALAALVLAPAAAVWWLWLSSARSIAPPPMMGIANVADALSPDAAPDAAHMEPASVRVERDAPGIAGTAVDADGLPLVGWTVELLAMHESKAAGGASYLHDKFHFQKTLVDEHGAFAFEGLAAHGYSVALARDRTCLQRVSLAPGERREVSLRLSADQVAVSVTMMRAGKVDMERWIAVVRADGHELRAGPDEHGVIHCVLAPGLHRLRVIGTQRATGGGPTFLCEYTLGVPAGVATAQWQFEVGGAGLALSVDTGTPDPVEGLAFTVEGRTAIGDIEASFAVAVHDGAGSLKELPSGSWTVHATSPWLLPVPPQELVVGPGDTRLRLVLPARRAAVVRLEVVAPGRKPLVLPLGSLPPLLVAGETRACVDLSPSEPKAELGRWRPDPARPVLPGYASVPLERAELLLADRELDGALVFLPFDPVAEAGIDVVAGSVNRLRVEVAPRAFVDLRACERSGREDPFARIQVFAGERCVRSIGSPDSQRWQSYLPPGDYRAVVDRRGRLTESYVRVDRSDVLRRLRP